MAAGWFWIGLVGLAAGSCLAIHRRRERRGEARREGAEPLQGREGDAAGLASAAGTRMPNPVTAQSAYPGAP